MDKDKIKLGGQAVINGVMMRSKNNAATAVRMPDGRIHVHTQRIRTLSSRYRFLRVWGLRGVAALFDTLKIGMDSLFHSASILDGRETEQDRKIFLLSLVLAVLVAVLLFKFMPLLIAQYLSRRINLIGGHYVLFNLMDGFLKIIIFIIYLLIISRLKDIREVFEYHGAEHRAVHCYESGGELNAKNAERFPNEHPRCGTAFLLLVFLVSVLVYTAIPAKSPFMTKLGLRLLLLPVIIGFSYEFMKIQDKFTGHAVLRMIALPGILLQKLTTSDPDGGQIEVALSAVKAVLEMETKQEMGE